MIKKERWGMLHLAESAALLSGHYLKEKCHEWQELQKASHRDVKIHADRQSEELIVEQLQKGSNIIIFSEETGVIGQSNRKGGKDKKSDLMWIVDPLDGSLNYHQNIPFCCVSIALYEGTNALLGVVYDFYHDELFSGIVDIGAWLNHDPIRSSRINKISEAVLGTGFPVNTDFSSSSLSHFISQIQQYRKVRLMGSAALSLCYVACGRIDAYKEENIMFWDVAAGCAVVKASGGTVKMKFGDRIEKPITVVASNNQLKTT